MFKKNERDTPKNQVTAEEKSELTKLWSEDISPSTDWKRSKLGTITGFAPLKRNIKASGRIAAPMGKFMWRGIKGIFSRTKVVDLDTQSTDPEERFRAAMEQYGRSDEYVEIAVKASARSALVYSVLTILLTIYAIYLSVNATSIYGYLFPFVLHPFLIARSIRGLFWNWQLRNKSLRSFHDFRKRPGEWIPSFNIGATTNITLLFFGVTIAYFATSHAAYAQDSEFLGFLGNPPSTDVFSRTLGFLFGGVGPIREIPGVGSPWLKPLAEAFRVFNSTMLTIASGMLGWHTLSGMIATAQQGQVLGQRWNQIWAPVRVTAGVGALVPMASGFSAMQILVLQIALWGSGLANQVWYVYLDTFAAGNSAAGINRADRMRDQNDLLFAMSEDGEGRDLVLNMFEKAVCLRGLNAVSQSYGETLINRGAIADPTAPEALPLITGKSYFANNALVDLGPVNQEHYFYGEAAPALSLQEVHQGDVQGFTAIDYNGSMVKEEDIDWKTMSKREQHQQMVETGFVGGIGLRGNKPSKSFESSSQIRPIIEYNFGKFCGKIQIKMADILAVSDFLEQNSESDNEIETAKAALTNAADRLKANIDGAVMLHINKAADNFTEVYLSDDLLEEELDQKAANVLKADGVVGASIFNAYSGYLAISREGKNGLENALYSEMDKETSADRVIKLGKELGWSSSGAFYMTIARMNKYSHEAVQINVESSGGMTMNRGMLDGNYPKHIIDIFEDESRGLIPAYEKMSRVVYEAASPAVYERAIASSEDRSWLKNDADEGDAIRDYYDDTGDGGFIDPIQKFVNNLTKETMMPILLKMNQPDPANSFLHMVEMGHTILAISSGVLGMSMAAKAAAISLETASDSFWASFIKTATGPFGIAGDIAANLAVAAGHAMAAIGASFGFILVAVGLVHAYIIPMLPFIFMFFFTAGMLILIGEALVAAPIWAFMHIRMDGEEFVDQVQKPGYMIAFNLFLRPTLAVFGLILSFSIFSAAFFILDELFNIAAEAVLPSDTGIAIIGIISLVLIQLFLHYHLALRSFSLISQVPDRVARWFGQGGENLNEEQDSRAAVGAMVTQGEQRTQTAAATMGSRGQNTQESGDKTGTQNAKSDTASKTSLGKPGK